MIKTKNKLVAKVLIFLEFIGNLILVRLPYFFGHLVAILIPMIFWLIHQFDRVYLNDVRILIKKLKTGKWYLDYPINFLRTVNEYYEKTITFLFYRNKPYVSKIGRVRSKAEFYTANCLYDLGFRVVYEKPLKLPDRKAPRKPDFYVKDHKVYIEVCGGSGYFSTYNHYRDLKETAYQKYKVPIIWIEKDEVGNRKKLERIILERISVVKGKNIKPIRRWYSRWIRKYE